MPETAVFSPNDFKKTYDIAKKFKYSRDPLSQFIKNQFTDQTRALLSEYDGGRSVSDKLESALLEELNKLGKDETFINKIKDVAKISLDEKVEKEYCENKTEEKIIQLNRMLMEAAYPQAFGRGKIDNGVHVDKIIFAEPLELGPRTSHSFLVDPRHTAFVLSRYKFCAKLLEGKGSVLEVGCGDAFGTPIVAQSVGHLFCVDLEEELIEGNKQRLSAIDNIEFHLMNMVHSRPEKIFDACFSIDVLEHLKPEYEKSFMENICTSLSKDGIFIVGTPNVETEKFESEPGVNPHINLKSHKTLKQLMDQYFINSFIFSMNDEVVHTGFYPMAHYYFSLGVGLKK